MIESAVILAVGSVNHQSQLTHNRPRAMLPVLGKPLVARTMELLYRAGIRHYIVVVGENEGAVAAYLSTQWLPDVQVEFGFQSQNSSLTRTLAEIARQQTHPFLVASYNTFTHSNFPERLLKQFTEIGHGLILSGSPITLSFTPYWFAQVHGHEVARIAQQRFGEHDTQLLAGLAVCGDEFIRYLVNLHLNTSNFTPQFMEIASLYLQAGGTTFFAETAWTLQVESDWDLLTLNKYMLNEGQDCYILSEIPSTVQIIPPVRIDPNVSVGQKARIGPHVYLESGSTVGAQTVIQDAVLLQNGIVSAGQKATNAIISSRARVEYAKRS